MKLKKSQLTGQTAQQVMSKINEELDNTVFSLIEDMIGPISKDNGAWTRRPSKKDIHITSQQTLKYLLRDNGNHERIWLSWWVDEPKVNTRLNDEVMILNDTVRVDVKINDNGDSKYTPGKYDYDVFVNISIIQPELFLESTGIEPIQGTPKYVDILGNEIHVGDKVIISYAGHSTLYTDQVKKLTPRFIVLEGGSHIPYNDGYENKLAVVR